MRPQHKLLLDGHGHIEIGRSLTSTWPPRIAPKFSLTATLRVVNAAGWEGCVTNQNHGMSDELVHHASLRSGSSTK